MGRGVKEGSKHKRFERLGPHSPHTSCTTEVCERDNVEAPIPPPPPCGLFNRPHESNIQSGMELKELAPLPY